MYIRATKRVYKGKTYTNHLLVESVQTPKGPRQRTICSLGSLAPAPAEDWLALAHKLEAALRGQASLPGAAEALAPLTDKARRGKQRAPLAPLAIDPERVTIEQAREAGPVHVGHQMWRRLGLDAILKRAGLSARSRRLAEAMTLNRLIHPLSEHAMPGWIRRTALEDILREDFSGLQDETLYRNLDRLHPNRERIERELAAREKTLFALDGSVYLYDLTSTYFEGQMKANPQAKRGYSRDKRPDCKQLVIGLVLDRGGFPLAHEVFDGNLQDRLSLEAMLEALDKRVGRTPGATVVVDRGLAFDENLEKIRQRGQHYLVAGRQPERNQFLEELEQEEGWQELLRAPSPRHPSQKKPRVWVKTLRRGGHVWALCRSDGRQQKDRAIRERHEARLLRDLGKLGERIAAGRLKSEQKIQQAIGRLQERYPRVARYYRIRHDAEQKQLLWNELAEKKALAEKLDGSYVLKTDRQDLTGEQIWREYVLLTRVEDAFRDLKSPLLERPIFHQLQQRAQTHIFLCVLAYHLLAAIEQRFVEAGIETSWWGLRQQLATHQVVTVALPTSDGRVLRIRKATAPEPEHRKIYATLGITAEVIAPVKSWQRQAD